MTVRKTLDQMTSNDLDQLWERLERAERFEGMLERAEGDVSRWRDLAEVAEVRQKRAEAERDQLREDLGAALGRAGADRAALIEVGMRERARQAAIERVRKECDALDRDRARLNNESFGDGYADAATRIRLALDGAPSGPATTPAAQQRIADWANNAITWGPTSPAGIQPADRTAQSGVDTPGCTCGHTGKGLAWHDTTCPWRHAWDETATADRPDDDYCGAEPPGDGTWGDCWCTLPTSHPGQHHCQPCTKRHGAPGWTYDEEATK